MPDPNAKAAPAKKGPGVLLVLTALFMALLSVGVVAWAIPLTPCPTCKAAAPPVAAEPSKEAVACPNCKAPAITVDRFRSGVCPSCKAPTPAPVAADPPKPAPCGTCNGEGKISLFRKWAEKRIPADLEFPRR